MTSQTVIDTQMEAGRRFVGWDPALWVALDTGGRDKQHDLEAEMFLELIAETDMSDNPELSKLFSVLQGTLEAFRTDLTRVRDDISRLEQHMRQDMRDQQSGVRVEIEALRNKCNEQDVKIAQVATQTSALVQNTLQNTKALEVMQASSGMTWQTAAQYLFSLLAIAVAVYGLIRGK